MLSYFRFLNVDSKIAIFKSHCNSFYGTNIANLYDKDITSLDKAWRVAIRILFELHKKTHSNLLPSLINSSPPSTIIRHRMIKFIKNNLNNKSDYIKYFMNNCLTVKDSIMYKNLIKVAFEQNLEVSRLLHLRNSQINKLFMIQSCNWRSNIIREILYCLEGSLNVCFVENDLKFILDYICTYD